MAHFADVDLPRLGFFSRAAVGGGLLTALLAALLMLAPPSFAQPGLDLTVAIANTPNVGPNYLTGSTSVGIAVDVVNVGSIAASVTSHRLLVTLGGGLTFVSATTIPASAYTCVGATNLVTCTPTEGAGVGAVGALVLALIKGIRPREIREVVLDVGRTSGPLLLLLFCAQLYSRVLSMTGFTEVAKSFLLATGLDAWGILIVMVAIWFVLGCLIDSISIILLTVPIFAPIAAHLGFDPLAFAIIGILAIETGLLTPPFGILVFTVKAAVPDRSVELAEIFRGAIPYWIVLLTVVVAVALFPQLATFLPNL